jgi:hypothetical protein
MPDTGQRGSAFIVHSSNLSGKQVDLTSAAIRLESPPGEMSKGVFGIGLQVSGREVGTSETHDLLVGSYYADPFPSASNAFRLIVHRRPFSELSRGVQHLSYQEFSFWGPNRSSGEPLSGSLANLGDLTGDSRDEFVVTRPRESFSTPYQTKVVGYFVKSNQAKQAPSQARPILASNRMPATVEPAGDVDGDGLTDLVVAVPGAEVEGEQVGVVYIIYGASLLRGSGAIDLESSDVRMIGEKARLAGVGLASAGDVNGDGRGDFIIGAPAKESSGRIAGAAYVVYGF